MFFKHFASKNRLPGFCISETLVENGLTYIRATIWNKNFLAVLRENFSLIVNSKNSFITSHCFSFQKYLFQSFYLSLTSHFLRKTSLWVTGNAPPKKFANVFWDQAIKNSYLRYYFQRIILSPLSLITQLNIPAWIAAVNSIQPLHSLNFIPISTIRLSLPAFPINL